MHKTQRTFTKAFKLEAVQLARSSQKSMAQIARDLGIAESTLHRWCQRSNEYGEQAFPESRASAATRRRDATLTARERTAASGA